ncbi:MAG TPA: hypothetical protein VKS78_07390 [Roseiarcus sp.]|nr:hypothetical protein [Roseiarcus sp.]
MIKDESRRDLEYLEANDLYYGRIDPELVLAYSEADLKRALRDLESALRCLSLLGSYLFFEPKIAPQPPPAFIQGDEQDQILAKLNEERLFPEALARIGEGNRNNPRSPDGSPSPTDSGSP